MITVNSERLGIAASWLRKNAWISHGEVLKTRPTAAMPRGGRVGTMRRKGQAGVGVGRGSLRCERVRTEEAQAGKR